MVSSKPVNAGFTLIEALIVLAITAILAAVAFPQMQRMIATQRAYNRADQILSLFQFARAEAIRTNQPVLICPTTIRQNAATSNGCVNFSAEWQGFMAFNDKNMDGSYTQNIDSMIRVVAVNQNNDNKLTINTGFCNFKQNTCNPITGSDVLGFMPNGQFGIGNGTNKSNWRIGQSNVIVEITDIQYASISRRIVVTPSGKPVACYGKNSTNIQECSLALPNQNNGI